MPIDTEGFRFEMLNDWSHVNFLPGAIKYGDLPTLLALSAPHPLWINGEKSIPAIVSTAFHTLGKPDAVTLGSPDADSTTAAIDWIRQSP